MADYDLSFTQSNESPWVETGWSNVNDTFQIDTNGLRPNVVDNDCVAKYNTTGTGDDIDVEISITTNASGTFDPLGVCILDSTTTAGYILRLDGANAQIFRRDVGTGLGSGVGAVVTVTATNGTFYKLKYTKSTGLLTVYVDGVSSFTRTDTTYQASTLVAGVYGQWGDSRSRRIGQVAINGIGAPAATIDTYPATVRSGDTGIAYTTTGLVTVSSITVGSLSGTSISDTLGDGTHSIAALADTVAHQLYGTKTVTITGTGGAPTTSTSFQPPTGYSFVTLSGTLNTTDTGVLYNFSPAAAVGDQIVYVTANGTVDAQGNYSGDYEGTQTMWHIDATDNVARSYSVITGASTLKYWNGSAWVAKPLKYWNGSAWVAKTLKYWNGSAWV